MSKQNIVILGSTGSIGVNTLEVVERFKEKFNLVGIAAAGNNINLLKKQIEKFKPEFVAISENKLAGKLNKQFKDVKTLYGLDGVGRLASLKDVDAVVIAISGSAELLPLLEAIKAGKTEEALGYLNDVYEQFHKLHDAYSNHLSLLFGTLVETQGVEWYAAFDHKTKGKGI